jgi:hypothetical protein
MMPRRHSTAVGKYRTGIELGNNRGVDITEDSFSDYLDKPHFETFLANENLANWTTVTVLPRDTPSRPASICQRLA